MGKLALVTKVGVADQGLTFPDGAYQASANVSLLHLMDKNDISVNAFLTALKKLRLEPTERMMDLLVIASSMYSADTRISRSEFAEDSWTRMIDLYIPVSEPDFWNGQTNLLQKIFKFLTGDIWNVKFRSRSNTDKNLSPRGRLRKYGMPYATHTVCLFSGGMDSFIGAVDLLESGIRPLLVGHAKSVDVSSYQQICEKALGLEYGDQTPERIYAFIRTPKEDLFGTGENTERGRSFLFLSLGAICAASLSPSSKLVVPENGMISLNIPLTPLRVGSHSTRTTHPYYFKLMQTLFDNMDSGVTITNPYQFKTKG
ncbi:MAG: Qat anti-phage system QueC-like protein QatC [Chitinophagaceae bacterium]